MPQSKGHISAPIVRLNLPEERALVLTVSLLSDGSRKRLISEFYIIFLVPSGRYRQLGKNELWLGLTLGGICGGILGHSTGYAQGYKNARLEDIQYIESLKTQIQKLIQKNSRLRSELTEKETENLSSQKKYERLSQELQKRNPLKNIEITP